MTTLNTFSFQYLYLCCVDLSGFCSHDKSKGIHFCGTT